MTTVLQVITDTDRRGAQVFATDLHRGLARRGLDVRTVALAAGRSGGLEHVALGRRRLGLSTLRALRREISSADVVIAHGSSTLPACAIATLGTGVPFVYRQISDTRFWAANRLRRWRVRAGLTRAERIVALWSGSADTLHTYLGVPRAKLRVIPNGVDPDRFSPVDDDERARARSLLGLEVTRPVIGAVAALVPEKGLDLAVRTLGALTDVSMVVVGDGPARADLEALATRNAPGRVVFTGALENPRAAIAAADVLVLPSRGGDSMPAALIEAGLMGIPVVSTPVGAIPELVVDGDTGLLVPVGDLEALTDAIRFMLSSRADRDRFSRAATLHCERRYAIGVVAAMWSDVLDECCAS
jgi:glycosyltransferase involved in cell wall biosynthesis